MAVTLNVVVVPGACAQVPLPELGGRFDANQASLLQDVVVSVAAVNALSVSASAVTLTVGAATAGEAPTPTQHAGTTYNLTTNGANKKLTATLSELYAPGITLSVTLEAPPGATATAQTLGTGALDLVTGLSRLAVQGLSVTYTAEATLAAAPNADVGGAERTVTFTLTDA